MECQICCGRAQHGRKFLCVACARSALYNPRLVYARTLLEKEALGRVVEAVANGDGQKTAQSLSVSLTPDRIADIAKRLEHDRVVAETAATETRTSEITRQAEQLRHRLEKYRVEIAARKDTLTHKRGDLERARLELVRLKGPPSDTLAKLVKKLNRRYNSAFDATVSSRIYLCRDAAVLAGLQLTQGLNDHDRQTKTFVVGGYEIVDLRDLNKVKTAQINSSLGHITQLLALVCRYLQLRLPAEIVMPRPDYPLATILPPSASYVETDSPSPVASPDTFTSSGRRTRIGYTDLKGTPRPRPLYIDQELASLAKDDPAKYGLFVEGIALLAWNIAWLCRTQGFAFAATDFEGICSMARNLWLMLVAMPEELHVLRERVRLNKTGQTVESTTAPNGTTKSDTNFGIVSHGTTRALLGSASSTAARHADATLRAWQFSSWQRMADMLKAYLLADMSGAEWEMLDDAEFGQDAEMHLRRDDEARDGDNTIKGWTKLRSRGNPP